MQTCAPDSLLTPPASTFPLSHWKPSAENSANYLLLACLSPSLALAFQSDITCMFDDLRHHLLPTQLPFTSTQSAGGNNQGQDDERMHANQWRQYRLLYHGAGSAEQTVGKQDQWRGGQLGGGGGEGERRMPRLQREEPGCHKGEGRASKARPQQPGPGQLVPPLLRGEVTRQQVATIKATVQWGRNCKKVEAGSAEQRAKSAKARGECQSSKGTSLSDVRMRRVRARQGGNNQGLDGGGHM